MLLSTDIHGINTENRTWKCWKGDIKLQFQNKSMLQSVFIVTASEIQISFFQASEISQVSRPCNIILRWKRLRSSREGVQMNDMEHQTFKTTKNSDNYITQPQGGSNITLMRSVSPLEVSTTSVVSVTA